MSAESVETITMPVTVNPMTILDRMAAAGVEPDKLGRVIDLVEAWNAGRAKEAYAVAMNRCQGDMPIVLEDSQNKHTRSAYASLEAVNKVVKPCYTKHGFSIQFAEGEAKNAEEVRIIADVMHDGGHERRYWIDLARDGKGAKGGETAMNPVQGKGSTFSYGQRYLTKMIFNLTISGEDNDGNGGARGLNEGQVVRLNELFADCRDAGCEVDMVRFWSWVGCQSMNDMQAKDFARAEAELVRKLKGRNGK